MKARYGWWLLVLELYACQGRDLNFSIRFREVSGLKAKDPVFLAGREVGLVQAIEPVAGENLVVVTVRAPFRPQITACSRFTVEADPAVPGRQSVFVLSDPQCQPLEDGAVVEGTEPTSSLLGPLLKGLGKGVQLLQKELKELNRELEELPKSPQLRELEQRFHELARQMREAEEKFKQDVLPQLQREMEKLRRELEQLKSKEKPSGAIEL